MWAASSTHLSTRCPEVLTPVVCERYTKKTHQTFLRLPINMLESSWRKVPSGKSSLPLRVSQPCNHHMAKTWQKCPNWNVDQQTDQGENCWEKNKNKQTKQTNKTQLSLTCYIAGFEDKIYKRRLKGNLYWVCISTAPRGLIWNSRHVDLSQKVLMAPSLFAFHQSFDSKSFFSWEGLGAQFLSVANFHWGGMISHFRNQRKKI